MPGQKEAVIENKTDNNEITIKLNIKFQARKYELKITSKRKWILAVIILGIKFLTRFFTY